MPKSLPSPAYSSSSGSWAPAAGASSTARRSATGLSMAASKGGRASKRPTAPRVPVGAVRHSRTSPSGSRSPTHRRSRSRSRSQRHTRGYSCGRDTSRGRSVRASPPRRRERDYDPGSDHSSEVYGRHGAEPSFSHRRVPSPSAPHRMGIGAGVSRITTTLSSGESEDAGGRPVQAVDPPQHQGRDSGGRRASPVGPSANSVSMMATPSPPPVRVTAQGSFRGSFHGAPGAVGVTGRRSEEPDVSAPSAVPTRNKRDPNRSPGRQKPVADHVVSPDVYVRPVGCSVSCWDSRGCGERTSLTCALVAVVA